MQETPKTGWPLMVMTTTKEKMEAGSVLQSLQL